MINNTNPDNTIKNVDFNQLVPKYWVHKRLLENVYVTSIKQIGESEHICGAIIPQLQQHSFVSFTKPAKDILLLSEIGRQVALACAHNAGISYDSAFVMQQIGAELNIHNLTLLEDCMIHEIEIRASMNNLINDVVEKAPSTTTTQEFYCQNKLILKFYGTYCPMTYKRYKRLRNAGRRRRFSAKEKISPLPDKVNWKISRERSSISKFNSSVLKISNNSIEVPYEASLIVDKGNLFFFDHYCDHVPGILILQGLKELAIRHCGGLSSNYVTQSQLDFQNFAELNYPVKLNVVECKKINPFNKKLKLQAIQNDCLLAEGIFKVSKYKSEK